MCHAILQDPNFFLLLKQIDRALADEVWEGKCQYCGNDLHRADFPRKPRDCPPEMRDEHDTRYSFCCCCCRKRHTAMSVRFMGRRLYFALAVVLGSARHAGQNPAAARLAGALHVPVRTLDRWRHWWQERFMRTSLWQAQCARFLPPLLPTSLPGELISRFGDELLSVLQYLMHFLTPLSIGVVFDIDEAR